MEIGSIAENSLDDRRGINVLLTSTEQTLLRNMEDQIGSQQVTRKDLE